jgi:hypothetical protein
VLAALLIESKPAQAEPAQRAADQPCTSSWTPEVGGAAFEAEPTANLARESAGTVRTQVGLQW